MHFSVESILLTMFSKVEIIFLLKNFKVMLIVFYLFKSFSNYIFVIFHSQTYQECKSSAISPSQSQLPKM